MSTVKVEVAFSPAPGTVDHVVLSLPVGATVEDALRASGLLDRHPSLAQSPLPVGVWGRVCELERVLREGDRVEVYRPLTVDPKEARRLRYQGQPRKRGKPSGTRMR